LSPAAIPALVVRETDATYSDAHYAMLLSEKVVLLQKKYDKCLLMGYRIRYSTQSPQPAHGVFHGQQVLSS
jgi:hypothetical protein